ncbi:MAG: type II toxin-antitoxin system RelE/ParE family toxin [Candidatus Rokubacteria bacterium]|nr:type II toxin-antitoxin system RelE/ParE family toxin [Candidatus Rokubacteria bacterium]
MNVTPPWLIEFYESEEGGCPVREFLDGLDKRRRAKLLAIVKLLEEEGPTLPFPYSSQVRGKLRELRAHYGREIYRVLYFGAPNRTFVLLHALEKRTEKLPERDISVAETRMEQHLEKLKDN